MLAVCGEDDVCGISLVSPSMAYPARHTTRHTPARATNLAQQATFREAPCPPGRERHDQQSPETDPLAQTLTTGRQCNPVIAPHPQPASCGQQDAENSGAARPLRARQSGAATLPTLMTAAAAAAAVTAHVVWSGGMLCARCHGGMARLLQP
jgi:hypothetical protein